MTHALGGTPAVPSGMHGLMARGLRRSAAALRVGAAGRRAVRLFVAWLVRRRRILGLAAALAGIAVLSTVAAWLIWQEVVDRRLELGGSPAASSPERSLLAAEPTRDGDGRASLVRDGRRPAAEETRDGRAPAPTVAARGSSGLSVSGGVLAAAAAAGALAVGVVGGALVLRRYRRADDSDHEVQGAGAVHAAPDDRTPPPQEQSVEPDEPPAGADEQTAGADETPAGADEPPARAEPAAAQAQSDPASAVYPGAAGPQMPAIDTLGSAGAAGTRLDIPAELTVGVTVPLARTEPVSSRAAVPPTYAPGQRVYEKRRAPRISYVCQATLEWRASLAPVTVLDLSELGLRCRLQTVDATPSPPPKALEIVQVVLPVGGRDVTVTGRVSWRRAVDEAHEFGMDFTMVSPEHKELLRATCSAGTPVP